MGRGDERLPKVRCVKGVQFSVSCIGCLVGCGCGWSEDSVFMFRMYITVDFC
jgi:hypothetical protein